MFADVDDGVVTYLLRDPVAFRAVEVDQRTLSRSTVDNVAALVHENGNGAFRARLLKPRCDVPSDGWVPDYKLFSDLTLSPGGPAGG